MRDEYLSKFVIGAALLTVGIAGAAASALPYSDEDIAKKLVHQIRLYPRYTIFDHISIRVNEGSVELLGQVSQPFKRDDLGHIAQHVPGVISLTNDIKVLPLSSMDDHLRFQVSDAIYQDPLLSRYSLQPSPPIHIIVDHGHVTLEGVVGSEAEKEVAGIRANGAGLSFGVVTNNLRVENTSVHDR